MRHDRKYHNAPWTSSARMALRYLGALLLLIGMPFAITGFVSLFSAFGSFGPPKYFWCAFVGLPLIGIGGILLKAGFIGAMSRYAADETTPNISRAARHAAGEVAQEVMAEIRDDSRTISARFRALDALRDRGLINEDEYRNKRAEILADI